MWLLNITAALKHCYLEAHVRIMAKCAVRIVVKLVNNGLAVRWGEHNVRPGLVNAQWTSELLG